MPRIVPFIVAAVLATVVALVAGGIFAEGLFVEHSPGQVFLYFVGVEALLLALAAVAGRLADRWTGELNEHPAGLVLGEIHASPASSPIDLESEILDADCRYLVHLGAGTLEQPWAASPLAEDVFDPGLEFSSPEDWLAELAPRLLNEAGVTHGYEKRGNLARVVIPRIRDSGFDVTVEAATFGLLVRTGTLFHAHFSFFPEVWDGDEHEREEYRDLFDSHAARAPAEQALGLVRDLLSPAVRIRERRAAGISYHAALEMHVGGQWRRRRSVTLLRYPYWGRREQRLWANTHLGPRTAE